MNIREKLNSLFNSRIFRIIFSLLVAMALWTYVEYVENADILSGGIRVTVEFLNPELVADRNLIITEYRTETITLEYSGKRSNIRQLYKAGAIRVTANLGDIKTPGANVLPYNITFGDGVDPGGLTLISRSEDYVLVNVENAQKKEIPVVSKVDGKLAEDGYQAEAPLFTPETIIITGPKSEIERVVSARVNIQRENLTKTVTAEMEYMLIDDEGTEVKSELITADRDAVTVTIPIRMIKDIPLTVSFSYAAGATGENTVWEISPETITISGEPEVLNSINSISLGTIDLGTFESYYTQTHQIILSNDITNVTGVTTAEVTVSIKGLDTKNLTVPLTNVQITNETAGYITSPITTELEVTIRGTPSELQTITEDNIRVIIDMAEFGDTTGAFSLPAQIKVDGDSTTSCGAIGDYKVTVRVTQAGDGT